MRDNEVILVNMEARSSVRFERNFINRNEKNISFHERLERKGVFKEDNH